MSVAVLIPCYNEAQSVAKVVADFKKALPEAIIYVFDNNSTDGTAEIAKEAGAIVIPEYQQGKGHVIRSMFRKIDADCYLIIDGDDTYPAESAREMAELILDGKAEMVIGDRLSSTYFTENKRKFHNMGNKTVRFFINKLFKARVNDIMTGYRAFSKGFVKTFPVLSGGFEIETEMTIHALDKRMLLREIPVAYRDRPEGSVSKLHTVRDGARVLKTIFTLVKEYRPLLFFGIFAILLALAALALFIPVFSEYLKEGLVLKFPTLFVAGFIGLSALLSFACGVILDTIASQNRKLFELELNRFHMERSKERSIKN